MIVTFVSQCQKNAANKTRRVLDSFANRIGDRVWQTMITQEGVVAVKKLLRKTASKNTAVSCHWIRGKNRTELLWIVGDRYQFDSDGVVPVNCTDKDLPELDEYHNWFLLPAVKSLVAVAALLHDWGKSSSFFQSKLKQFQNISDPLRHEWISCVLLNALVQSSEGCDKDDGWLQNLSENKIDETRIKRFLCLKNEKPLTQLPPVATMLAWLILSHHRMPTLYKNSTQCSDWKGEEASVVDSLVARINKTWGYQNEGDETKCFAFPNGILLGSSKWTRELSKRARALKEALPLILESKCERIILHFARLCLILGDHYYSSLESNSLLQGTTELFANTSRASRSLKQKLDEHLLGVTSQALRIAHYLPSFEREAPVVQNISSLKRTSPSPFQWQDRAAKKIRQLRESELGNYQGYFCVNMASTGCGKTFANAKIMRALSEDGDSLRYVLALGLRTLTLQTGDEYRSRIGLDGSEMAVLIGSAAVKELHDSDCNVSVGSESLDMLYDENVDYECEIPVEGLATVLTKTSHRQLLYSPVLVCTIDHIIPATESIRGGHFILPSLRLLSSDLVIDEVDDFSDADLTAIGRLVHFAGMMGRKVMISSATIPPDLALGYFNAYMEGWKLFSASRKYKNSRVGCVWVDEFSAQTETINADNPIVSYEKAHAGFVAERSKKLSTQPARRKAQIIPCEDITDSCDGEETRVEKYFNKIKSKILELHAQHQLIDNSTGISVSFGVVRIANISPCVEASKYFLSADWGNNCDVRVMTYHSRQVLLMRHVQERYLDSLLKRSKYESELDILQNKIVRDHIADADANGAKNLIFILVATPVEELGRDHDFDWAVIEPSSYRSIIQMAGRIRRHRREAIATPNIALMEYNLKGIKAGKDSNKRCYQMPGYETSVVLNNHSLSKIIDVNQVAERIDAIPRILKPTVLKERDSLVDLEHYMISKQLACFDNAFPEKLQGYLEGYWYMTGLPQVFNKFRSQLADDREVILYLLCDDYGNNFRFYERDENNGNYSDREDIYNINRDQIDESSLKRIWFTRNYEEMVEAEAELRHLSKRAICMKYGEITLQHNEGDFYFYSEHFGLFKKGGQRAGER